ncbi:coatomer subunit gamma, variant 2 [Basidiobolus ranarum]|uniref:Coatomer subunit gamma n=1 Tax=Basidiobolus ranarum TaxID=34480 RepID=A0ABR2W5S2_9FUNG
MSWAKKDEDGGESGLLHHLDKTTVLQEARVFNETPISPKKCRILLAKIAYLLYVGESFATNEATDLFFSITKLFQSKDTSLRQIVYLVIKELSTVAQDVIMITSSLTRDMQPNSEAIYRSNAIRALCKIVDGNMLQGVERFLKAAIVDKTTSISSAALVSSYHMLPIAKDVVRRWANEVQEAMNSKSGLGFMSTSSYTGNGVMSQYHAMGLLYQIRQHDRMAVIKLVQSFAGSGRGFLSSSATLRSTMAHCLLIRYACKVMEEDPSTQRQLFELLEGWLRHKSDMVNFEAAKAICNMQNLSAKDLFSAVSVLQHFLSSSKPTLRFAAIRTLNRLAMTNPTAVTVCNIDMENLITDSNRSVATFAITTLLKTGNEASVDRLMKQITGFMSEISDEFKVIVVEAIRSLCLKFPAKHGTMLAFLSSMLRDEGGYEFKRAVVEAIFDLIKSIPESKEVALSHLCEFIEDCEFTKISVRILHLLGVEGPKTPTPTVYIRYIYNRIILENAIVRAAAVSALGKFGVNVADENVKKSVRVLLTRCLDDVDDEVRDRATWALKVMGDEVTAEKYVKDDSSYALAALERSLVDYCSAPERTEVPFDISIIPQITRKQAEAERHTVSAIDYANLGTVPSVAGPGAPAAAQKAKPSNVDQQLSYAKEIAKIPEFASYGPLFKSSLKPVELTESETEYVVTCTKHMFSEHVVFQFHCHNTLNDSLLENVSVIMQTDDEGLEEIENIPVEQLAYDVPGSVFVSFKREDSEAFPVATFSNTMKFVVKDCDPTTGEPDEQGYEDEYLVRILHDLVVC